MKYEYRPSRMQMRSLCPASARMEHGKPEETNEAAEEGTMLHKKVETGDFAGLTAEQEKHARFAYDYTNSFTGSIYKEKKMRLLGKRGILMEGTADFIAVQNDKVFVFDYKCVFINDCECVFFLKNNKNP